MKCVIEIKNTSHTLPLLSVLSATLFVGVDDLMANGLHDRRDIPIIPKK